MSKKKDVKLTIILIEGSAKRWKAKALSKNSKILSEDKEAIGEFFDIIDDYIDNNNFDIDKLLLWKQQNPKEIRIGMGISSIEKAFKKSYEREFDKYYAIDCIIFDLKRYIDARGRGVNDMY
jgi:hypothetical protein